MSEHVPSINDLRLAWRKYLQDLSSEAAEGGLCSFFSAHDAGVRNSVVRPEWTAKEHLEAAFDAADPVPANGRIPKGVEIIARWKNGDLWSYAMGSVSEIYDYMEVRTLEPLPPLIPDDCEWVLAGCAGLEDGERYYWRRGRIESEGWSGSWWSVSAGGWARCARMDELIDPVPIPKEGDR